MSGRHLLGYCLLGLGAVEKALGEFKKCVKGKWSCLWGHSTFNVTEGYLDDWQLLVELSIELDEKKNVSGGIDLNADIN